MRRFLVKMLAASSFLLLGATASAQYRPRSEPPYQERAYRAPSWMFEQLRTDLDRAEIRTPMYSGDRHRISVARQEIAEFRRSLAAGYRDEGQFDEMVNALQRVIHHNAMSDRNREELIADLDRLHDWWIDYR